MTNPAGGASATFWSGREWLFSLSLANLVFLRTWAALLEGGRNITPTAYAIAIGNVLLIALCIRSFYFLVQRRRNVWLGRLGVLLAAGLTMLPVHAITTIHFADAVRERNIIYACGLAVAAAIVVSRRFRHAAMSICVVLSAAVAVTFGQSLWRISTYDAARYAAVVPPTTGEPRQPRLVWVLFDEWSYALAFADRPAGVALPELDRLVRESFHAANAEPPGDITRVSVPRLVTGDMTATAANMADRPNVFATAKQNGLRTAVVGWYMNYCGAYAKSIDVCWTPRLDAERNSMGAGAGEIAVTQLRNLFENQFRSPFGQPLGAKRAYLDYRYNARTAVQAAASPAYDFVYVHLNVPHEPFFYDAASGRFNLGEKPIVSMLQKDFRRYLDALQLVDRTLGEMRRAMERTGVWDDTHVLLTSDHSYRRRTLVDGKPPDTRVPFIVKVAGSDAGAAYDGHFDTVIAPQVTTALLRREITTAEQLRSWIDKTAATAQAAR